MRLGTTREAQLPAGGLWLLEGRALARVEALLRQPLPARQRGEAPKLATYDVKGKQDQRGGAVAVLGLQGIIEYKQSLLGMLLGGTDLQAFAQQFEAAVGNPRVDTIVLYCDSPGGSGTGVPETAAMIRKARSDRRVVAYVDPLCASACYWLASAASEVVGMPSCEVGSIGVYDLHVSHAGALEKAGEKVTIIAEPPLKTGGNPYENLDPEAAAEFRRQVVALYQDFVKNVAVNRRKERATVERDFGRGMLVSAKDGLRAGMLDRLETASEFTSKLLGTGTSGTGKRASARKANAHVLRLRAEQRERQKKTLEIMARLVK